MLALSRNPMNVATFPYRTTRSHRRSRAPDSRNLQACATISARKLSFSSLKYVINLEFPCKIALGTRLKHLGAHTFVLGVMRFRVISDLAGRREAPPASAPRRLTLLVLGDCRGDRRRIARLSELLHQGSISVDAILVLGLLPPPPSDVDLADPSREGDASATLAAIENISPRVFYAPALYDPSAANRYETDAEDVGASAHDEECSEAASSVDLPPTAPRLTAHSMNVLSRPVRLCDDLVVTSSARRTSDGNPADSPSWCSSLSQRLRRPDSSTSTCDALLVLLTRTESRVVPKGAALGVSFGDICPNVPGTARIVDAGSFGLNGDYTLVYMERTDCGHDPEKLRALENMVPWRVTEVVPTSLSRAVASLEI
jgi:hypothetical protein